jgi:hypothetical protein
MIRFLNQDDVENTKHLFYQPNYMGINVYENNFYHKEKYVKTYHDNFCYSYLSDLKNYKAIGKINENNEVVGFLSYYQSPEDPSWYGTQIRSVAGKQVVRDLLDKAIELNENDGRYKFYTLWSANQTRYLRRFAYNTVNNERYDYFDEIVVPAKTKCLYTMHWHILFHRILLPVDTVVRCTFLKQQYRTDLPVGGII